MPEEENVSTEECSDVQSQVASRVASVVKKKSTDINLEIIEEKDIKVENHSPQPGEVKASGKEVTDSTDETRGKRKRKAPQRYEVEDMRPQLATSRVTADPEVEAYLLNLKQLGYTVDPEAFSSGSKRRKTSDGSGGKGRSKKEFMLTEDLVSDVLQQKPSPKYEYLDSDDSFDEEPEVLPESGKMTRGQRLEQRRERLSQGTAAGADKKPDVIKLEVIGDTEKDEHRTGTSPAIDVHIEKKEVVPLTKPNADAAAVKRVQPASTPGPMIKKEKPTVAAPYLTGGAGRVPQFSSPRGRGRGALTQPNIGKLNPIRANHTPTFAGRNNQYRAFSMPNASNNHVYQPRSAVAHNSGPRQPRSAVAFNSGPRPVRFQQGQVRERKGDVKPPSALDVQKSSLEDLKKNSRDNVEMMLQSVGMIAVTSSAMGQSKIFGSEKRNLYPPVKNMQASNLRQPSHLYDGFMNKPFSSQRNLPSQQTSYRGQNRFASGSRGRFPAHPQPYRGSPAAQLSHGQGFGMGMQRGRGQQFSSNMRGSMRGRGANPPSRGNFPSANVMRGSARGRGANPPARGNVMPATKSVHPVAPSRGGAGLAMKQMKPLQTSGDVIVIDDDDIQEIAAGPSGVLPAGGMDISTKSPRPGTSRGSKGNVAILDVDMDCLSSDIKIIADKTQGVASPTGSGDMQDSTSLEQLPHDDDVDDDGDIDGDDVKSKHVSRDKSNDSLKAESEALQADIDNQTTGKNGKCPDKVEDVDILPGEDIDGWKVCLAEDSDSNDDAASPQPSRSKSSAPKDHSSPAGSAEHSCSSPQHSEAVLGDLTQTHSCQPDSDSSQKVQLNDSEAQVDAVCQSVSATAKLPVEQSDHESQDDDKHNAASEMMCHEQEDICDVDIKASMVSNQMEDAKSESPVPISSTLLKDESEAGFEDVLQELNSGNLSLSVSCTDGRAEDNAEDADTCMQTALTANTSTTLVNYNTIEDQEKPLVSDSNGDSSVALSADSAELLDKETSYNGTGTDNTDCETAIEENCLTETDFETSSAVTVPESGILAADIEPGLSCTYTSNGCPPDEAEVDSVAPPSDIAVSLEADSTHSHVDNSKSNSETDGGSAPLPACCSTENNIESTCNNSSSSPSSHSCPATAADCLRDGSNLLDIFTEIEKTCKEMEQTLDSEADKKSQVLAEPMDVSRVVSDLSGDLEAVQQQEPGFNGVLKVADQSNGAAFSESRSDNEVKESRSGDCRYSDMIYEKEVIDNGNVSSLDEEDNTSKHVDKEVTGDECGM